MSTPPFSTVWQPDTPATVQENLNISAPKISGNWNTIAYWGAQDHNPLGQTTNIGQHLQSTYVTQSAIPAADANNIRLFSQLITILSTPNVSIPQVFAQYPTGAPVQLTQQVSPTVYLGAGNQRQTEISFTIGGTIIKMGLLANWPAGVSTVSYGADNAVATPTPPPSTPFPTSVYFSVLIPAPSLGGTIISSTTSAFTFSSTAINANFLYIACGN